MIEIICENDNNFEVSNGIINLKFYKNGKKKGNLKLS